MRVLVPTDFSACADAAFAAATDLFGGARIHVVLVHVVDETLARAVTDVTNEPLDDVVERLWSRAFIRLEERKAILEDEGHQVTAVVRRGETFAEIADAAEALGVNLIVVGSHGGATGRGESLFGGTAERVVRGATVPVLCVPDRTETAAARTDRETFGQRRVQP